ncbi:OstA organic solvent tolerance protein [Herbaspirillum hiltneri N3]|uniref:LPS-assembly protein LptD n=1 Tax=Herbaspirillum hiltneri N3 TaxID=1262470 RepID=A0ABM5UZ14_9BURK|nr:LPS-assembly protein LptD [Herbaspirillum hiltneri]AKZ62427.1 OstA organic solvent tolerance protein [Herbaspirillum hiltneri N3]
MIRFFKFPFGRRADLRMSRFFTSLASLAVAASATSVLPISAQAQTTQNTPAKTDDKDAPVNVSAEQMTGRPDRQINLDRDVEVVRGETTIKADKAEYRIIKDEVEATGHVWMKRLQDRYTGDKALMNMDSGKGYVTNPTYLFGKNGGRGKAEQIDFLSDDQAKVTEGTYSTCEALDPDWYIQASTMDLDSGRDVGTMHGGIVYFKGVPILGAPLMSFPLSGERKSGVLPPTFGVTSTGGAELTVPYYFNIAPNRDLTLYPRYIARRGLQLGVEGRYLGEDYSGTTKVEGIQDRVTGTGRYSLSSLHSQTLAPNLVFGWNVNKASDNDYPSDFSHSVTASTQRLLTRDVSLVYSGTYWSAVGRMTKYQLLQDINNPIQKPYDRVPQLTLTAARQDVGGFDFNFASEFARFSNTYTLGSSAGSEMVGGDRMYANQSVSYPIIRPGYFITPKASLDATTYRLNNVSVGAPTNLTRVVPTYSLDAGMTFERDTNLFGRDMTQTLEPRLFYVRTPYRDQNQYPNFDSGLADFNYAQIFSENRFVGHDRISDANQITGALVSRFIEQDGLERLRAAIGQRFYFADPKVTLDGTSATVNGSKSDLLLSLGGQITRQLSLDNTVQYSETLRQMVRSNFGARWQPAPKKVLNLTYRLDRTNATGILKQMDISGQWPVSQRWYAVSRINYSIPDKTVAEGLLGMEYKADCWVFRLVAQRIPTSSSKASTSFFIQLELNGFSKIGSNPLDALSASIPGYQIINKPDDLTRY